MSTESAIKFAHALIEEHKGRLRRAMEESMARMEAERREKLRLAAEKRNIILSLLPPEIHPLVSEPDTSLETYIRVPGLPDVWVSAIGSNRELVFRVIDREDGCSSPYMYSLAEALHKASEWYT